MGKRVSKGYPSITSHVGKVSVTEPTCTDKCVTEVGRNSSSSAGYNSQLANSKNEMQQKLQEMLYTFVLMQLRSWQLQHIHTHKLDTVFAFLCVV